MRTFLILILAIVFLVLAVGPAQAQAAGDSPYIFKIRASACKHTATERVQTGFHVRGLDGIVTALHGVVDCNKYILDSPNYGPSPISDLYIEQADIERDVALIQAPVQALSPSDLLPSVGLDASDYPAESGRAYVIGFPDAVFVPLRSTLNVRYPAMETLRTLIPPTTSGTAFLRSIESCQSPAPGLQVLSLEGHLVPGHSGAPILDSYDRVIGVGNGGLEGGRIEIAWAIPWTNISWMPRDEIADRLNSLGQLDQGLVFSVSNENLLVPTPEVSGLFTKLYHRYRTDLGSALLGNESDQPTAGAEMPFQFGHMFSNPLPYKRIWVVMGDDTGAWTGSGTWREYRDAWLDGQPEFSCPRIADYPKQPRRGFGRIWCENGDIRDALGWGLYTELWIEGQQRYQEFQRGFIFRDSDGATNGFAYVFFNNGRFVRESYQ